MQTAAAFDLNVVPRRSSRCLLGLVLERSTKHGFSALHHQNWLFTLVSPLILCRKGGLDDLIVSVQLFQSPQAI